MDPAPAPSPAPPATAPARVFDAHLHLIDPAFPLTANDGYVPQPFTAADYRARSAPLPVAGGAVVAGSFQRLDTSWVAPALAQLGPGFRAVVNLSPAVADAELDGELDALHAAGARALRINLFRGGAWEAEQLDRLARRAFDRVGWHTEFYADVAALGRDERLMGVLTGLPRITVDHFGMSEAREALLRLVASGAVVKATGLGRIDIADPAALTAAILAENPAGLMFGSDLPSTRARRPDTPADAQDIAAWAGPHAPAVMWGTGAALYGAPEPETAGQPEPAE